MGVQITPRAPYFKEEVDYTDNHGNSPEQCSKCKHFVNSVTCSIVRGLIRPGGWCNKFEESWRTAKS